MKKWILLVLAFCLLISPALALDAQSFIMNEKNYVDLDGDNADETVILEIEGPEGEEYLALYLFGADGSFYTYEMYVMRLMDVFTRDINGDGLQELCIVCDYYSDDYVTYCFNYTEAGGMILLPFEGLNRGGEAGGDQDGGYGRITAEEENVLTLTGSQDVLGTWMAGRDFALQDGRFALLDGLYEIQITESDWEDRPLILAQPLQARLADGNVKEYPAGTRFLPVSSDLESIVYLVTRDGEECSVEIAENTQNGWGWIVNGIAEEELFEYVPYAD